MILNYNIGFTYEPFWAKVSFSHLLFYWAFDFVQSYNPFKKYYLSVYFCLKGINKVIQVVTLITSLLLLSGFAYIDWYLNETIVLVRITFNMLEVSLWYPWIVIIDYLLYYSYFVDYVVVLFFMRMNAVIPC